MPSPPIGAVLNYSRLLCAFQQGETVFEYAHLLFLIKGFSQGVAVGVFNKIGSGWFDPFADCPGNGYANGHYFLFFYFPLNQTDGLVTDASAGYKEGNFSSLGLKKVRGFPGSLLYQNFEILFRDVPHEAQMTGY